MNTDFYITDEDKKLDPEAWRTFKEYVKSQEGKDIVVSVSSFTSRRSKPQLRTFWLLMSQIQKPVNFDGNNFSQEEISDMLKLLYFYRELDGVKIPRSISNKSDCTKEEMTDFLENILFWCGEHGFKAEITSAELLSLINQYEV